MSQMLQNLPDARKLLAELPAGPKRMEKRCFEGLTSAELWTYTEFRDCVFRNCIWQGNWEKVRFVHCKFENVQWVSASLCDVSWEDCHLLGAKWLNCKVQRPSLSSCEVAAVTLEHCDLGFATLSQTIWREALFADCRLVQWVASSGVLQEVTFQGGSMQDATWADYKLLCIRMQELEVDRMTCAQSECENLLVQDCKGKGNRWVACQLRQASFERLQFAQCAWSQSQWHTGAFIACELPYACYDGSQLTAVSWSDSTCTSPLFDEAVLHQCSLRGGHMPGMSLRKARLSDVDLAALYAPALDAREASLSQVDLAGADFSQGNLTGQPEKHWIGAKLTGVRFKEDANLRDEQWWGRFEPGPQKKEQGSAL